MATYDYSKFTLVELIKKIGNSRYWNLPKMLEEVLMKLNNKENAANKVYRASITQTGTNAPVATVLENNTGREISYSRDTQGLYIIDISGDYDFNKVYISLSCVEEFSDTFIGDDEVLGQAGKYQVKTIYAYSDSTYSWIESGYRYVDDTEGLKLYLSDSVIDKPVLITIEIFE